MTTSGDGRMLGRYQLLFMLGQGGMGEVHLARLTGAAGFEKLCIVKTVLPNLMGDQNFIDRFHHEARVLVQLTHSNIAQVYDMGEVDGSLYMAIEYVPGVDLSRVETRVERQRAVMPIPMAVYIGQQINEALGYAHRKVGADGQPLGIVHRDVSPQNVMVSYEGEVKVIDFGLAKSTARSKQTLPSTVMGKLGYMSPEQALAKPVDHRSDIFSSGIVVWEMLAGRSMYTGGTMSEMVVQMAMGEVPSLSAVRPDISPTLDQIVMRALAKEPSARYQRADDFARALNELAVRESMTVGAEDVGNYVRAMCPEEFAAERQLQSKLSVMRKGGPLPEVTKEPEFEGTFLRPSSPGDQKRETASGQIMTPAQRAMSMVEPPKSKSIAPKAKSITPKAKSISPRGASSPTPPVQVDEGDEGEAPIAVPKSKTPLIIVGLLAFIVLAGGALFLLQNKDPKADPQKQPVVEAALDAGAAVAVAVADPGPAAKDPEPEPDKQPAAREPVVLDTITVEGKVWKVLKKGGEDLVLLEKKDKLSEGDRVNLVGEPGADGKRPLYARAAVLSVNGSIAKLLFDEDATLPETVFAAKDASPKKVGVGKKDPSGKTEPVKTTEPEPVKVAEPAPVKTPEPEPVKVNAPASAQLFGSVRMSVPNVMGNRAVFVRNLNEFPVHECEFRLPSNVVFKLARKVIAPKDEVKINFKEFRPDPRPPDPQFKADWAAVYCKEGTGYWKTAYERR
ncbi:MAG: protein kinase [Archangium sp.]|nr:protein kinase [Archangium sp.]